MVLFLLQATLQAHSKGACSPAPLSADDELETIHLESQSGKLAAVQCAVCTTSRKTS